MEDEFEEYYSKWEHVKVLGDGMYHGKQSGYCFTNDADGITYRTTNGYRGLNIPTTLVIKNGIDNFL